MNKTEFIHNVKEAKVTINRIFNASRQTVWDHFTNGEILAKWWGPDTWPATTVFFDFKVGGIWHYFMTGPDGTESHGMNTYTAIDTPNSFSAIDSFCDSNGVINKELPETNWKITFTDLGDSTKITTEMSFKNEKEMQDLIKMGFEPGYTNSLDNLEKLLAKGI